MVQHTLRAVDLDIAPTFACCVTNRGKRAILAIAAYSILSGVNGQRVRGIGKKTLEELTVWAKRSVLVERKRA